MQGEKQWNFSWILFYKCYISDWGLDGGNRACSGWEIKLRKSVDINENSIFRKFWILINQLHGLKQKFLDWIVLSELCSWIESFPWRSWCEKLRNPICSHWENRVKLINLNLLFWIFWLSGLWWKDQKTGLSAELGSTNFKLSTGSLMEQIQLIIVVK